MQALLDGMITSASVSDEVKVAADAHKLRTMLVRSANAVQESIEYATAQLNSDPQQLISLDK